MMVWPSKPRQLRFLVMATTLIVVNWHAEIHDQTCSGSFRSWIADVGSRANICAVDGVDFSRKLPFSKSRFPPPERAFLRIGSSGQPLVRVRLDKCLRWLGSLMIIWLTVPGFPFPTPKPRRRKASRTSESGSARLDEFMAYN
jgi:hypothetical protein